MRVVVKIPNVSRDERIGSAFNHLFRVIDQTECAEEVVWDFADTSFFHPFFLAPLSIYKNRCDKRIQLANISSLMRSYLDLVCFENFFCSADNQRLNDSLLSYMEKTYIPICRFDLQYDNVDDMQSIVQDIIERQSKASSKIKTPLSYFLGELICNITQHSKGRFGYVFSQYLSKEKCINICIADDGITVYGSYVRTQKYLQLIGNSEAEALKMANEGYSTKDLPESESRGYGISSSKRMLVEGLGGSFFMLSGGAFHRHDVAGSVYIGLPKSINWNGTIILMKIPVDVPDEFNYIEYVSN